MIKPTDFEPSKLVITLMAFAASVFGFQGTSMIVDGLSQDLIVATLLGALMVALGIAFAASAFANASARICQTGIHLSGPRPGNWSWKRQHLPWAHVDQVSVRGYVVNFIGPKGKFAVNLSFFDDISAIDAFISDNLPSRLRDTYR